MTPPTVKNVIQVVAPVQNDGGAVVPGGATAKADKRGTVLIPKDVVQKAGFKPGENVAVYSNTTDKCIGVVADKTKVPAGFKSQSYTVDYHGNVRVTGYVFTLAGMQVGAKGHRYAVEYTAGSVTIKSAT